MTQPSGRHTMRAIGYVVSVLIAVAVYLLARRLLSTGHSTALGLVAAVLLVPASPALCQILQGQLPFRVGAFAAAYACELVSLLLDLGRLLLTLPLIAAQVLRVMLWVPLLALAIGLASWLLQEVFGLDMGVGISPSEAGAYAIAWLAFLVLEAIIRLTAKRAHRLEDRYTDSLQRIRAGILRRLDTALGPYLERD